MGSFRYSVKRYVIFAVLIIGSFVFWREEAFLPLSLSLLFIAMMPLFLRFEAREVKAEETMLIAVLSALAAVGRIPFAAIPSVQPTTFIVIMAGITLGAENGFIVGAVAALVSNLVLGQGPWTPWQMMAWGMVGSSAGLLEKLGGFRRKGAMEVFGFLWGFLFGWIMNIWHIVGFFDRPTLALWITSALTSAPFDLMHALSNVTLLLLFGKSWKRILDRMIRKFGLFGS